MLLVVQDNVERYIMISGVVKDKFNKKKLEYVNVLILGSSVGIVINVDGEFILKIFELVQVKDIEVLYVGYFNFCIFLKEENFIEWIVWFIFYVNLFSEILVRVRDLCSIVEEVFCKILVNYSFQSNMFIGFYRELV